MNTRDLTPSESLEVITRMIRQSERRIERKFYLPYLIWGWLTLIVGVAVYLLIPEYGVNAFFGWLALPIIGILLTVMTSRKVEGGLNKIDKIIDTAWTVIGTNVILVSFLVTPPLFIIMLLLSIAQAIAGFALGVKVLKATSMLGLVVTYAYGAYFSHHLSIADQTLYFSIVIFLINIIPGYYFMSKRRQSSK
ncbi:hypothetical protein [Porphyromonas cangingivalis]|uniref:Uncharacterized protein n=1 Tax=Porphyromonas cangingivalis TaxID=36874 RepID=A0A0A2EZ50_PORCN|nr:hypothetical protein [Porphyromonas cangingivalis]KGN81554.1 hypothetical protein HQ35_04025 [Porphyromonas cangingivalis]SJZ79051.1 hypothetical protein SAMN02745205_01908 [Porphyromonas cangingivalis]SPY35179.1 Uncharacterised protein [Porphyromonas cangingivalis]VEJ03579.1 Uncharacterised protein [Porphyromonas cangingivalis]